jgi:hypothetical protein
MTVRALLDGHQFDLQALAELFPDGDLRVCVHPEEAGRYCLEASELKPLFADPSEMHETATAILVRLTGAARLEDDSFRPVRLVGRYDRYTLTGDTATDTAIIVTDRGEVRDQVVVVAAVTAEARASAHVAGVLINGEPVRPEPRGPRYLDWAAKHADADELLVLVGNAEKLGWIELYKAYEIIKHAVSGGRDGIQTLATVLDVPLDEIRSFTASANRPDVSGAEARHARLPGGSPKRSMTLPDGRHFIRDLAHRWHELPPQF